jgi:hypothetical protein
MKISTIKKLNNLFLGKVVTLITLGTNKPNIIDSQFSDFYTGVLEELDEDGVILTHLFTGCKSFFATNSIVAFLQEQVLDENNPENKIEIEKIKQRKKEIEKEKEIEESRSFDYSDKNSDYNDIDGLEKMAEFARQFNEKKSIDQ